jgi:hypothetical protein
MSASWLGAPTGCAGQAHFAVPGLTGVSLFLENNFPVSLKKIPVPLSGGFFYPAHEPHF